MGFSLLLLPVLLAGADPQIIATGDSARIEQALSEGVRAKVEAGWRVVDVRTLNDELVVTVGKARGDAETFERHVVHFDKLDTYRVESDVAAPKDIDEPSHFFVNALAAPRGGVTLEASCGDYYLRPYLVDQHAIGEFAGDLVSRTLSTADNLARAVDHGSFVVFVVHNKGAERELIAWRDPKGKVIEAQLRRFEYGVGGATYTRGGELKKALARSRVTSIVEVGSSLALVTAKGRFVIDPAGEGFSYEDDGEHGGCGC
jgi:hypothetical protein